MNRQRDEEDRLDLMLSRGRLVGPAGDRVRDRVLDLVAPPRQPFWRRLNVILPGGLLVAAAAGFLLLARPAQELDGRPGIGDFRPKGAPGSATGLSFALTCSGAGTGGCPHGSRVSVLVTRTSGTLGAAPDAVQQVTAFAEPRSGGERIWYFSAEDGPASLTQEGPGGARLASRSVVLGAEHAPGSYLVHVLSSLRPLTRAEALDPRHPDVTARASLPLEVRKP